MMKRNWIGVVAAVTWAAVTVQQAGAATSYLYVTDKASYSASPGGTVTVNLFLQETLNGSGSLIAADGGLVGVGALLSQLSTGLPPNPATIAGLTLASASATPITLAGTGGFDGAANGTFSSTGAQFVETAAGAGVTLGNTGNGVTAPGGQVYLGTLTITAGSSLGTTTFALGKHDGSGGPDNNTLTASNLFDLD